MTLKDIDFSVAMYGTTPIIQSNYDVAYTGDESSINLRFAVTDEPDLEGATAIVHLKFADSSHIERALELTESVFSYTLKGTENKHAGVVRADIIITKGGAKFTRAGHKFKIDTSLDASVPLVEFSVDTLDTLVDGAEEWLLQAQIDFGTAQSQRAEEWVADNDARADEFAESQTDRTNAFDASEAARTTDFNASETGRSNTFTVNENAREAAAESGEAARDESFELSEYERTTTFGESEAGRVITFNGSEAGRTIAFNLAEEARSEGYANDHDRAGTDHTRAENDHDIALTDQENYVTLLTDLQETINDANENIAEFDVALQNGIVATNIAAELQNLEETYAPDLFTVKQQLEQKLDEGQVSITDINKNLGKFDQTYMSDEFLQQIAGTTPVNAVPADDSITLKKTTFYEVGKNLFDKNAAVSGFYVNHLNGTLVASATYWASEYILIVPNTTYTINKKYWLAFYDANKVFISGVTTAAGAVGTILTPVNAVYVRISVYNTLLNTTQLELGASVTTYAAHVKKIPTDYLVIPDFDPEDIPEKSVTKAKTDFIIIGKNKFDKTKAVDGYINQANGVLEVTTAYKASDFIDVSPLSTYSFTTGAAVRIAYYTSAKTFISGTLNPAVPVTTPENCAFIRYSFTPNQLDLQQFEEGTEQTEYQSFGYVIDGGIYQEVKASDLFEVDAVIAPAIPAIVGKEVNIYFENILNDKAANYQIDVTCSVGAQQNERWTAIPTTAGTYSMTIKIFKNFSLIKTIATNLIVKALAVGNGVDKKALIIGDSTVANGIMAGELNKLFNSDVMGVTLIGTKGTAPVKHEGISGWTAEMFYTDPTSPFVFSGAFDFSQYMTSNDFASTDYVIINLGINDMFSFDNDGALNTKIATALTQYQAMIDNIKVFDANIKIGLAVTIPPNYSQDAFGKDYSNSQTRWRYKRNNYLWIKALINQFKSKEVNGVYLIPINVNLDTEHNFDLVTVAVNSRNTSTVIRSAGNSGVHPALSGYYQIADMYFYWLKSFEV